MNSTKNKDPRPSATERRKKRNRITVRIMAVAGIVAILASTLPGLLPA